MPIIGRSITLLCSLAMTTFAYGEGVALRTADGRFLSVADGRVVANKFLAGENELFKLTQHGEKVAFSNTAMTYITAEEGGGRELVANRIRKEPGNWEWFVLRELGESAISLQANRGQFVTVRGETIEATSDTASSTERFELLNHVTELTTPLKGLLKAMIVTNLNEEFQDKRFETDASKTYRNSLGRVTITGRAEAEFGESDASLSNAALFCCSHSDRVLLVGCLKVNTDVEAKLSAKTNLAQGNVNFDALARLEVFFTLTFDGTNPTGWSGTVTDLNPSIDNFHFHGDLIEKLNEIKTPIVEKLRKELEDKRSDLVESLNEAIKKASAETRVPELLKMFIQVVKASNSCHS